VAGPDDDIAYTIRAHMLIGVADEYTIYGVDSVINLAATLL
jgi:hypothetical protein